MLRTPWGVIVAGLATTLVLSACGGQDDASSKKDDAPTVRIAHNSNAAILPARIAQEQGYFKEAGLNVTFKLVENVGTLPPALGKSFDIVQVPPTSLIAANAQGIKMVGIAGATVDIPSNPTSGVVTLKSSGITSLKQLKGKTLGVLTETGTLHTATRFALDKVGVPLDSVKIVQVDGPAQADQLRSGRVDAVETLAPFRATLLASGDTVDLGDPYLIMAPELGAMMWGAQGEWANKNPKLVEGFRTALTKAIAYTKANDKEARASLKAYTGLSDAIINKTVLPTYDAALRPQDLDIWLNAMKKVGGFNGKVELADLIPATK